MQALRPWRVWTESRRLSESYLWEASDGHCRPPSGGFADFPESKRSPRPKWYLDFHRQPYTGLPPHPLPCTIEVERLMPATPWAAELAVILRKFNAGLRHRHPGEGLKAVFGRFRRTPACNIRFTRICVRKAEPVGQVPVATES